MKIEYLAEVGSTNEYIKRYLSGGEDVIVCAARQTQGKGTKGRSFLSNEGGVYLSALNFYPDFPAENAFRIMAHAAVAVCRTAEAFGAQPEIKWCNDVLLNGRKLCGILIENGISEGRIAHSIVGIGMNVENDISALGGIAATLREVAPDASAAQAREILIENYLKPSSFDEYLSRVKFLGKTVCVTEGGKEYLAVARAIHADGRLEIIENGSARLLSAAEISIKI